MQFLANFELNFLEKGISDFYKNWDTTVFDALYKMALLFFENYLRKKIQVFASIYRLIQKT